MTGLSGCRVRVRGVVQGVGFRPFVFRLARHHALAGSVANSVDGVDIVVEGAARAIQAFVSELETHAPSAAAISAITVESVDPSGIVGFQIRSSVRGGPASAHIATDLPVCDDCVRELFDPQNRRYRYPYITCSGCGPRFSLTTALPYDRQTTTMADWRMCAECEREFKDPRDRRFHAQPIACPGCGPHYRLIRGGDGLSQDYDAVLEAAQLLTAGAVLAVKGIGGYHLACDAGNTAAVAALRDRKYRKAQAFALMVRDLPTARTVAELSEAAEALLVSSGRPIVLAPPRIELAGVAPDHPDLGLMLPYAPLHYLLFAAGAPQTLVMTSGNRSSEPIAFEDADAHVRLDGIADAFLVGDRAIARRVDDSVAQTTALGPIIVRRSRGYAPAVVARLGGSEPILAVGGDLKNTIALVIGGEVMVSQHIGDLEYHGARGAFQDTIRDFLALYDVDPSRLTVAHDQHPQYVSTGLALEIGAARHVAVQHHRAHVASVLAERAALGRRVLGIAFDGTGFGDDGTIWGGEFLVGSVEEGFERLASLRPAGLAGGDAAAAFPVQALAGFLADVDELCDLSDEPFRLPAQCRRARQLVAQNVRTFRTTSVGRLFDAVAALLGFTERVSFEAQAAIWLEDLATRSDRSALVAFEYSGRELDWRPALRSVIEARLAGEDVGAIARGFHRGLAEGIATGAEILCDGRQADTVVLTGGVFQNQLLLSEVMNLLAARGMTVWINRTVPSGDGGLSLGQAAIASLRAQ